MKPPTPVQAEFSFSFAEPIEPLRVSPLRLWPRLLGALEQLESHSAIERDKAQRLVSEMLAGSTLAKFVSDMVDRGREARPWWQWEADGLLSRFSHLLSADGEKFCRRMRSSETPPLPADAQTLRYLGRLLWGDVE